CATSLGLTASGVGRVMAVLQRSGCARPVVGYPAMVAVRRSEGKGQLTDSGRPCPRGHRSSITTAALIDCLDTQVKPTDFGRGGASMIRLALSLAVMLLLAFATPAQDPAKARLEKSPRHGEWVKVKQGKREVQSFIVYPEVKQKATAVV